MQETCGICGREVPYSLTAHVLIHTGTDEGVVDYDVCRSCYEDRVAPLFEASPGNGEPSGAGEGPADGDDEGPADGADEVETAGGDAPGGGSGRADETDALLEDEATAEPDESTTE